MQYLQIRDCSQIGYMSASCLHCSGKLMYLLDRKNVHDWSGYVLASSASIDGSHNNFASSIANPNSGEYILSEVSVKTIM